MKHPTIRATHKLSIPIVEKNLEHVFFFQKTNLIISAFSNWQGVGCLKKNTFPRLFTITLDIYNFGIILVLDIYNFGILLYVFFRIWSGARVVQNLEFEIVECQLRLTPYFQKYFGESKCLRMALPTYRKEFP